jgi:hypothetical protein
MVAPGHKRGYYETQLQKFDTEFVREVIRRLPDSKIMYDRHYRGETRSLSPFVGQVLKLYEQEKRCDVDGPRWLCRFGLLSEILVALLASSLFIDNFTPHALLFTDVPLCSDALVVATEYVMYEGRRASVADLSAEDLPAAATDLFLQILHTLATFQENFGIVTFQCFLENCLLKSLRGTPYFRGQALDDVAFWCYNVGKQKFYLPNRGYLVKVTDFSLAQATEVRLDEATTVEILPWRAEPAELWRLYGWFSRHKNVSDDHIASAFKKEMPQFDDQLDDDEYDFLLKKARAGDFDSFAFFAEGSGSTQNDVLGGYDPQTLTKDFVTMLGNRGIEEGTLMHTLLEEMEEKFGAMPESRPTPQNLWKGVTALGLLEHLLNQDKYTAFLEKYRQAPPHGQNTLHVFV